LRIALITMSKITTAARRPRAIFERAARGVRERRMSAEAFVAGKFGVQIGEQAGDIELQHRGVSPGEAADVNLRRKDVVGAGFEGANVIGLDLRALGHLIDIKLLLFAGEP